MFPTFPVSWAALVLCEGGTGAGSWGCAVTRTPFCLLLGDQSFSLPSSCWTVGMGRRGSGPLLGPGRDLLSQLLISPLLEAAPLSGRKGRGAPLRCRTRPSPAGQVGAGPNALVPSCPKVPRLRFSSEITEGT